MPPVLQTVHIGCDNLFRRAGASVTDPAGWVYPSRTRDGLDWLMARCEAVVPTYFTVDLGVGNSAFPNFLFFGQTNMGALGILGGYEYSDDGVVWTPVFYSAVLADQTSAFWSAYLPLPGHRYWRVGVTAPVSGQFRVGEIMLGVPTTFTIHPDVEGWDPTDEELRVALSRTESGFLAHSRFLGAERRARVRIAFADYAWANDATAPAGFRYWVEQFVLTGRPFVWGWGTFITGPYQRDHFWAVARGGVVREFGDSYHGGQKMVEFELLGAREWGYY